MAGVVSFAALVAGTNLNNRKKNRKGTARGLRDDSKRIGVFRAIENIINSNDDLVCNT